MYAVFKLSMHTICQMKFYTFSGKHLKKNTVKTTDLFILKWLGLPASMDNCTIPLHTRDEVVNCRWCELHLLPDYMQWYNTGELHFTLSWLYHYKCWCYQQYDNYAVIWGRDGQRSSDNQDWEVELWTSQRDQSWQSAGTYILDGRSGIVLATP